MKNKDFVCGFIILFFVFVLFSIKKNDDKENQIIKIDIEETQENKSNETEEKKGSEQDNKQSTSQRKIEIKGSEQDNKQSTSQRKI